MRTRLVEKGFTEAHGRSAAASGGMVASAFPEATAAGVEVSKHEVLLPEGALRQTGEFEIALALHSDVEASVKVTVVAD